MRAQKPSPALVVSIVALIVAMSGTAVAARVLITSSSQIQNQTIRAADLHKGAVTKSRLNGSVRRAVFDDGGSSAASGGGKALEAHRLAGPEMPDGGESEITSLTVPRGSYAVFAKVNITPSIDDNGLLNTLFKDDKTVSASCSLDVGGTGDFAIGPIVTPGSAHPVTLMLQLTRTIAKPAQAVLTCRGDEVSWRAADASIIAVEVASGERTETGG